MLLEMMKMLDKFFAHNWLAILYLNFKMLPFRQACKLPLDCYNGIRFSSLKGRIIIDCERVYRGMIKIGSQGSDMFPFRRSVLSLDGCVKFHGKCTLGCSTILFVRENAVVEFGENVTLGANNLIFSEERIKFDDDVLASWHCQFLDSDTHHMFDANSGKELPVAKEIVIGKHSWIGNHVKINKGSIIPADTIIASCSLVNKDFSTADSFSVLAGAPARFVRNNVKWEV